MSARSRIRRLWFGFLGRTLNPRTLQAAREGRGPFTLLRHTGRTSGRTYETPIIVAPHPDGAVAELTYGPEVQWYRNLLATGTGELERGGLVRTITAIEPLDSASGLAAFTGSQRIVLRLLRRRHFVLLRCA